MENECRNIIVSEEYADFITETNIPTIDIKERFNAECVQELNEIYSCAYTPISSIKKLSVLNYPYKSIPTLYGLMDTVALEESGILKLQNQPALNLKGRGVLVAVIDTGIDCTHRAFRDVSGNTRIVKIWDQSDNSGSSPEGFIYGTEYNEMDINNALKNGVSIVDDQNGHGTFMAGVVGGSADEESDFVGAAPECSLLIVKLKPAKRYLREFYFISEDVPTYQENDIIAGLEYAKRQARNMGMPLVVVIGLGSNRGGHIGRSVLSISVDNFTRIAGNTIVIAAGNEGDVQHHTSDVLEKVDDYKSVEISVGGDKNSFIIELWGKAPDVFSVGIVSPSGEVIPRILARIGEAETVYTIFDDTVIDIEYAYVEQMSGDALVIMRFIKPSEGIWRLNVYGDIVVNGRFDAWLGISGFLDDNIYFLESDPDATITTPGDTYSAITVSSYSANTGAFDVSSSRGFLRNNVIKPDIAAPGVGVMGPVRGGGYVYRSGTSIAAAIVAGSVAQILEWGMIKGEYEILNNEIIKSYLIRGAKREDNVPYPSKQWGYGKLDIFNTFNLLR